MEIGIIARRGGRILPMEMERWSLVRHLGSLQECDTWSPPSCCLSDIGGCVAPEAKHHSCSQETSISMRRPVSFKELQFGQDCLSR